MRLLGHLFLLVGLCTSLILSFEFLSVYIGDHMYKHTVYETSNVLLEDSYMKPGIFIDLHKVVVNIDGKTVTYNVTSDTYNALGN